MAVERTGSLEARDTCFIAADRQRVWKFVADHRNYPNWFGVPRARRVREGDGDPDGVGCVRELGAMGVFAREEVTAFEPPRRLEYRVRAGFPLIRHHRGEIVLEAVEGGTRVDYRIQFDVRVPGTKVILLALLRRIVHTALRGLTSVSESS